MTKNKQSLEVFHAYCFDCGEETIDNRIVYCRKCRGVLVAHYGSTQKLKLTTKQIELQNKKHRDNYKRYLRAMESI